MGLFAQVKGHTPPTQGHQNIMINLTRTFHDHMHYLSLYEKNNCVQKPHLEVSDGKSLTFNVSHCHLQTNAAYSLTCPGMTEQHQN